MVCPPATSEAQDKLRPFFGVQIVRWNKVEQLW
jgi:hypothetical protein